MLDEGHIIKIVGEVADAFLHGEATGRILSEDTIDSFGRDALRLTIVVKPGAAKRLSGQDVIKTLVEVRDRLTFAGDDRLPIVGYATEEELADVDSPDS